MAAHWLVARALDGSIRIKPWIVTAFVPSLVFRRFATFAPRFHPGRTSPNGAGRVGAIGGCRGNR